MGGGPGSHRALHLCRLAKKPILPITAFGGAAEEAFATELDQFDEVYRGRVPKESYTVLDTQYPEDMGELASAAVELASRIVSGNSVFIVMSFKPETDDTFNTLCRVVEDFDFDWDRTDQDPTTARIYNRIVEGIKRAALVVADVTHESLNVYYELGFAEALDKPVIVIAKEGIELPFDTNDIPTILYPDQTRLEEKLRGRIQGLTGRHSSSGK
jgi:hypothetical protein